MGRIQGEMIEERYLEKYADLRDKLRDRRGK